MQSLKAPWSVDYMQPGLKFIKYEEESAHPMSSLIIYVDLLCSTRKKSVEYSNSCTARSVGRMRSSFHKKRLSTQVYRSCLCSIKVAQYINSHKIRYARIAKTKRCVIWTNLRDHSCLREYQRKNLHIWHDVLLTPSRAIAHVCNALPQLLTSLEMPFFKNNALYFIIIHSRALNQSRLLIRVTCRSNILRYWTGTYWTVFAAITY
jgi:hypothetical protein